MDSNIKHCIISCGIGSQYPKGIERLKRSLIYHGYTGELLLQTEQPNYNYNKNCLYNVKAAAFEEAIKQGYTHITQLDCSIQAINDITKLNDIINSDGYYFLKSGYNAAQTCSDKCLEYYNITRDEAENIPDSSTCVIGVNTNNPEGNEFINRFIQSAKDGVFEGSRYHDNQSADPRFLFHRQDQSAASCIIGKMGLKMHNLGELVCYYYPNMDSNIILTLRGM